MPIRASHQKYLRFIWKGKVYQFLVLCFGITTVGFLKTLKIVEILRIFQAPFIFDRLGRSIGIHLKLHGIRMIIYLDDILVLSTTMEQCLIDAQIVVDTLASLGFMIKAKKSVTTPSQTFFYLGYLWDTVRMTCSLPPEKLDNIKFYCREIMKNQFFPLRLLLSLNGTVLSARPAVPLARAMARGLQRLILTHYKFRTKAELSKMICLTAWAKKNIAWWLNLTQEECVLSLSSAPIWKSIRLATDASDVTWGAVLAGKEVIDEWNRMEVRHTIAHKEWMAFEHMVRRNITFLSGKLVTWHVDNQNARLAYLNQGTVNDTWLCRKVVDLLLLLHEHQIHVVPVYVRSVHHLHADYLSRRKKIPDWHMDSQLVQKLFLLCGVPRIDLMATDQSAQLPLYYSPMLDEMALAVDSLVQDWDKFSLNFVFPPLVMVELTLNRIHQCQSSTKFLLITQWKPRATWFPKALLLSSSPPLRFPVSHRTVLDLSQSSCHPSTPSGKAMKFVAWRLSGGDGTRVEDCPLGLSPLFCLAGRKARRVCMDWATGTTPSSVRSISWTRLSRIQ